jgi:hypothetical protein
MTMVLVSCKATQTWVNGEYSRGLRTHPWGAPVFVRVSVEEVLLPIFTACGLPGKEVQGLVVEGGVQTQGSEIDVKLVNLHLEDTARDVIWAGGFEHSIF